MAEEIQPITESEAKQRIEQIEYIETQSTNIDVMKKDIDTTGFQNAGMPLVRGENIYRARIIDEKPTQVRELSYPPKQDASLNRANRAHNPIFYASSGGAGAVFEVNPDPGDKIGILKWRTTEQINLNRIGYSRQVLDRFDSVRDLDDFPEKELAKTETEGNSIMRQYFAELFTQPVSVNQKHHHKLTTAIAETFLAGNSIDGIMYPTVEMWANEDNVAIETEVVDQSLEPVSAEFIEIEGRGDTEIQKSTLDTCTTIENGELNWNGHGPQWQLVEDNALAAFKYEDGRWRVKNPSEDNIETHHDPNFEY